MALTIGAILALLALAVATYPFFGGRIFGKATPAEPESEAAPPADRPNVALDELDSIYQAIGTLQLERELGNVPEGLYREQLNAYRWQGALLLRRWEQAHAGSEDRSLEEEIGIARAGLYRSLSLSLSCSNCGRNVPDGASDCPECGVAIPSRPGEGDSPGRSGDGA